jgi:uncharacterized protein
VPVLSAMPNPDLPAPSLAAGITLFNQGHYYECHDVLEAIWMEASSTEKPFYQGILQIAVGLYHLGNHNWQGAAILLGEGVNRLRPFEPDYHGVAVASLVDCGWAWLMALQQAGASQVADLAQALEQTQTKEASLSATIAITVNGEQLILPVPLVSYVEELNPKA